MGEHFNENLRNARLASGMTQKEVAKEIGVAKSTYSLYESGNREPDVEKIKKLASLFGVSADTLLGLPVTDASQTLAAHFDGDDLTPEEQQEIHNFIKYVKSKRD